MDNLSLEAWSINLQKPNIRWLKWHKLRAKNQAKRMGFFAAKASSERRPTSHQVEIWDGKEFQKAFCSRQPIQPPKTLCLNENRGATLEFLGHVQQKLAIKVVNGKPIKKVWVRQPREAGRPYRLMGYSDFSQIEKIGTSAAVIFASQYDRARRIMGTAPPTVNIHRWSDSAFKTLFELGFFEVVGLTEQSAAPQAARYDSSEKGDALTLAMISGENGDALQVVSEAIRALTSFIDDAGPIPPQMLTHLNTAIGEAMINVRRHAYEPPFEGSNAFVPRWWFTAQANRATRRITAVIFDQGATIPVTLPFRQKSWKEFLTGGVVADAISEEVGDSHYFDAAAIRHAMKEGTTQTDEAGRGKGLPQMRRLIARYGVGKLTILSRAGLYIYASDAGTYSERLHTPVDGTLVEWEIEVPRP